MQLDVFIIEFKSDLELHLVWIGINFLDYNPELI